MGGNPYAKYVKELGRDEVIEMYKEYTMNELELLKLVWLELKDKMLGYQYKPLPCHGDLLLSWLKNRTKI
jgi:hypothetical protein